MRFFRKESKPKIPRVLQEGWQFYHRPTTLEPVGTVFRIDKNHRRYIVDNLKIKKTRGREAAGHLEDHIEIGAGVLAKLLGIGPQADVNVKFAETIVFELSQPKRELTSDAALDKVLEPFLVSLKSNRRADNQYYVIRETLQATAMVYQLSKERVMALGGEAALNQALTIGAKLERVKEGLFKIEGDFAEPMMVMFLPEEIKPISHGLGSDEPKWGRVPVEGPLVWED